MQQLEIVPTFVTQLDGKILPNAHAIVDVDGDDLSDLVFGSMNGMVAVYKISSDNLVKWKECRVNGCVSAICADVAMPNDIRIFVATADGACFVIQATESGDDFAPSAEFRVALNVCDVTLHGGFVVFGTREGAILVYLHDQNAFGGYRMVATHDLGVEIESFVAPSAAPSVSSPVLRVRCTTGELFQLQLSDEGDVSETEWAGPSLSPRDGAIPFLVDEVRTTASNAEMVACGSLAGRIELKTQQDEIVWKYQVPEAVVGIDRLTMADGVDAIVACTWSGLFYIIQDPHHVAQFRMVLPASSMFCADLVLADATDTTERVLVAISTSGMISIYRGLKQAVSHALQSKPLMEAIMASAVANDITTEEQRRKVLKQLLQKTDQPDTAALSALLTKTSVDLKDLIRLAITQRW